MIATETIDSFVGVLLKAGPVGLAVPVVLALLLALLVRFRTNSTHTIFRWLWRLISWKTKSNDTAFNEFMEDRDNLNQFRFIVGKARTAAQMHSLINWSDSHNEDILDINACGPYFNREQPGLKPADQRPNEWHLFCIYLALAGTILMFLFSTAFAVVPAALVTVNATNKLLLVDLQLTRSAISPGQERLSREQCRQPLKMKAASSKFSEQDATAICGFYADPDLPKFINEAVFQQRWVFGPFAAMLLACCWFLSKSMRQGNAALKMAKRLDRPRP